MFDLLDPAGKANETLASLIQHYQELAHLARPRPLIARLSRDPDDDHVIACALAANASLIVSGDRDLLDLRSYKGIRIINAADALRLIAP